MPDIAWNLIPFRELLITAVVGAVIIAVVLLVNELPGHDDTYY